MSGTASRRTAPGLYFPSALAAALPALTKNLALELGPIRVNLIAAMFRAHRLPMMDSSSRSVEEMSTVILQTLHKQ